MLKDGLYGKIEDVKIEQLEDKVATYNLEVEGYHVYSVGQSNIIVHNSCQDYHTVSNKNQKSINEFNDITSKNGIKADLNGKWNGHAGRHTNAYHKAVSKVLNETASKFNGNSQGFMDAMSRFGKGLNVNMMKKSVKML